MANKTNTVNTNISTPQAFINQTTPEKAGLKQGNSYVSSGKNSKAETPAKSSSAKSALEEFTHTIPSLSFIKSYFLDLNFWLISGLMLAFREIRDQGRDIANARLELLNTRASDINTEAIRELGLSVVTLQGDRTLMTKRLDQLTGELGRLKNIYETTIVSDSGVIGTIATMQQDHRTLHGAVDGMVQAYDSKFDILTKAIDELKTYQETRLKFDGEYMKELAKLREQVEEFKSLFKSSLTESEKMTSVKKVKKKTMQAAENAVFAVEGKLITLENMLEQAQGAAYNMQATQVTEVPLSMSNDLSTAQIITATTVPDMNVL
ncbi:MAG TPA: hypothetical protein VHA52_03920, partial [Candidatus Babeliaceae bacterium]|nr:hypothetical protein [Candidatus Babeliaceae bacterium]